MKGLTILAVLAASFSLSTCGSDMLPDNAPKLIDADGNAYMHTSRKACFLGGQSQERSSQTLFSGADSGFSWVARTNATPACGPCTTMQQSITGM
jgi:hypothetical protein